MSDRRIKPCPFCGAAPKIYWQRLPEISENGGIYQLKVEHKPNCFIKHINNGMDLFGQFSATDKEWLLETWNNRYEDREEQEQ